MCGNISLPDPWQSWPPIHHLQLIANGNSFAKFACIVVVVVVVVTIIVIIIISCGHHQSTFQKFSHRIGMFGVYVCVCVCPVHTFIAIDLNGKTTSVLSVCQKRVCKLVLQKHGNHINSI